MRKQLVILTLITVFIGSLIIVSVLQKKSDSNDVVDVIPESLLPQYPDIEEAGLFEDLNVDLVTIDRGFQLRFNDEQFYQVIGTLHTPTHVVHGVIRYSLEEDGDTSSVRYEAVVVQPDSKKFKVFLMYEVETEYYQQTSSLFTMIDKEHVMFVSQILEYGVLNYDLVKLNIETGNITVIAPRIWEVEQDEQAPEEDFFLSAHYEKRKDQLYGKLLLTSYMGRTWFIDVLNGEVQFSNHLLFPAYGDPGSTPPRERIFPSPDLTRFVYQKGRVIELSNEFQLHHTGDEVPTAQFSIDETKALMNPGIVWNDESSMFYLEYMDSDKYMGIPFDNGQLVYAQYIRFYDRESTLINQLELPTDTDQRMNVFGWMQASKVWIEYYTPIVGRDQTWAKGEREYKLYDVLTEQLIDFTKTNDVSQLKDPIMISRRSEITFPYLLVDLDNRLLWEPPVDGKAILSEEQLYMQVLAEDVAHIYHWDQSDHSWKWKGEYNNGYPYYSTPKIQDERWLVYERHGESRIDYYDLTLESGIPPNHVDKSNIFQIEVRRSPYLKSTQIKYEHNPIISVRTLEANQNIDVPFERDYMIFQGLHWLDEDIAIADDQGAPQEPAVIRINTKYDIYEIPYDLATNRLLIEGDWVYAAYETLLIMHGLLNPNSEVGKIDFMFEVVRNESENNYHITDGQLIDNDQANIEGLDYLGWEDKLNQAPVITKFMFFDTGANEVKALSIHTNGIYTLNRQILFHDPKYRTHDGIHVGMNRKEALQLLGLPNINIDSHWGYQLGDYIKFHLYFEEDRIKWLSLTMVL